MRDESWKSKIEDGRHAALGSALTRLRVLGLSFGGGERDDTGVEDLEQDVGWRHNERRIQLELKDIPCAAPQDPDLMKRSEGCEG